jgi:hypothetical protein
MSAPTTTTISATPARILIQSLWLEPRFTAEVQDLYSRPLPAPRPIAARPAA